MGRFVSPSRHPGFAAFPFYSSETRTRRLLEAAKRYALDIADGKRPRLFSLTRSDKLESYGEAVAILGFARAQASPPTSQLPVVEVE